MTILLGSKSLGSSSLATTLVLLSLLGMAVPLARAETNLVQNGDFSNGLTDWATVKVQTSQGIRGEYPIFEVLTQMPVGTIDCTPSSKEGNPFLNIEVPFGVNGYIEQQVTIPSSAAHLSFLSWGNELGLGEVNAYVIVVDASSSSHPLETFTPPPMLNPGDPNNPDDDTCTGNSPVLKSYDLSAYSGQTVKLRLGATSENCCGTNAFFDDVDIEAQTQQPDFSISVSPTDQLVVRSGGWNASVSVVLQSLNEFSGTVRLIADTSDPAIVVNFPEGNSVNLTSGSQLPVKMNVSIIQEYDCYFSFNCNRGSEWPALGKYSIGVKGQSGALTRQVSLTLDVRAAIRGVMNILEFGAIGRISSTFPNCSPFTAAINCFTAQQNFWIEAPNGTRVYWAQNAALFAPLNVEGCVVGLFGKCLYHVTIFKGWEMFPVFQVWDRDIRNTVLSCLPLLGGFTNKPLFPGACSGNFNVARFATTPFEVNFTSIIVGDKLMMSNDAATIACSARCLLTRPSANLSIPDGSFIVGSPKGVYHYDPEMVVVGPPGAAETHPSVAFLSDTYGHLSSHALLFDSSSWETPIARVLPKTEDTFYTQTAEFSANLQWNANGDFYYVDPKLGHPVMDQGLALQPDYNTRSGGAG